MDTPPLATPVTENTSNKRCPAVTGVVKPVVMPLLLKPTLILPDRVGDRLTVAPLIGLNVLLFCGAEYNCAVIVAVPIKMLSDRVVEKNPAIEVMIPLGGIVKASNNNIPPVPEQVLVNP